MLFFLSPMTAVYVVAALVPAIVLLCYVCLLYTSQRLMPSRESR